jgi:high-affinity iron transporter
MRDAFLGNYLIGLREGLEATLVVTVLVAFLVKSGHRERLPHVWGGVVAAVLGSVGLGALMTFVAEDLLSFRQQELFDAIMSALAVCFVTWMIFWMRRAARTISGDLRSKLATAIGTGGFAVVSIAFLAVVREGLETAVLFYAAARGATTSAGPLLGITGGALTAVVLGWAMYRSALRVNLSKFFKWTGLLLVLVAAGILKYSVHDFQEAGVLPGLTTYAFDISDVLDPGTWYAALLSGMFNITPQPSVLETIVWVAYLVPVLVLFLLPPRMKPAPAPNAEPPVPAEPTPRASPVQ